MNTPPTPTPEYASPDRRIPKFGKPVKQNAAAASAGEPAKALSNEDIGKIIDLITPYFLRLSLDEGCQLFPRATGDNTVIGFVILAPNMATVKLTQEMQQYFLRILNDDGIPTMINQDGVFCVPANCIELKEKYPERMAEKAQARFVATDIINNFMLKHLNLSNATLNVTELKGSSNGQNVEITFYVATERGEQITLEAEKKLVFIDTLWQKGIDVMWDEEKNSFRAIVPLHRWDIEAYKAGYLSREKALKLGITQQEVEATA